MMTVKRSANNSSQGWNHSGSDLQKTKEFLSPGLTVNGVGTFAGKKIFQKETVRFLYGNLKICGEIEADQESSGSSEEMESPRSVVKWSAKDVNVCVHSQILRIKEEDSHLGEDIGEGLTALDKVGANANHVVSDLPASPLGGKKRSINTFR